MLIDDDIQRAEDHPFAVISTNFLANLLSLLAIEFVKESHQSVPNDYNTSRRCRITSYQLDLN